MAVSPLMQTPLPRAGRRLLPLATGRLSAGRQGQEDGAGKKTSGQRRSQGHSSLSTTNPRLAPWGQAISTHKKEPLMGLF